MRAAVEGLDELVRLIEAHTGILIPKRELSRLASILVQRSRKSLRCADMAVGRDQPVHCATRIGFC